MGVAGCGVLALVLSTLGVYGHDCRHSSDQDALDLVERNGIGGTIMRYAPLPPVVAGMARSLDLDECRRPSAIHAVQSPDLA